jgi:hypothetical protein
MIATADMIEGADLTRPEVSAAEIGITEEAAARIMVAVMDIAAQKEEAERTTVAEITAVAANRMVAGTLMVPETIMVPETLMAADRMEAATMDDAKG